MTTFSRAQWGARASRGGPGPLDPSEVTSIALHWPAMSKPLRGVENIKAALRGWQAYHMDGHGWSDIGYQEAYDQDGNTYVLRSLSIQSGANGDTAANEANGAVLLILAPGEQPTDAMMSAVRDGVRRHRALFPKSVGVKGHTDVRPEPTACPGPITLGLIRAGAFEPVAPRPQRPLIRRTLRKITTAIQQAKADGYTGLADRLTKAREAARKNHAR
jgi:hypothetical protein